MAGGGGGKDRAIKEKINLKKTFSSNGEVPTANTLEEVGGVRP